MNTPVKNGYDMRINRPLANTYGWLHANVTHLSGVRVGHDVSLTEEIPEQVRSGMEPASVRPDLKTGMGSDMDVLLGYSGASVRVYTVPRDTDGGVLRLHYGFPAGNYSSGKVAPDGISPDGDAKQMAFSGKNQNTVEGNMGAVCVRLEDNAVLTLVSDYVSPDSASGLAAMQTKIILGKNARLRLVQIQRLGNGYTFLHDTGALCAENARLEVIRLILGGHHTYDGCSAALAGDKSTFSADIAYRAGGDGRLDMNYEAVHTGKHTSCEINASGVLRERAFKLFRGVIDFRRGCSGSEGNETEDVLLMDEHVRNQTVPMILCGEEDVVGNHGASIGRLDENLIFYLESRGMERNAIYEMCAHAKIDAVVRKIPDSVTVRTLFPWLCRDGENGDESAGSASGENERAGSALSENKSAGGKDESAGSVPGETER